MKALEHPEIISHVRVYVENVRRLYNSMHIHVGYDERILLLYTKQLERPGYSIYRVCVRVPELRTACSSSCRVYPYHSTVDGNVSTLWSFCFKDSGPCFFVHGGWWSLVVRSRAHSSFLNVGAAQHGWMDPKRIVVAAM